MIFVASNIRSSFEGYGRRVYVHNNVADVWDSHRQVGPDSAESFGILVGTTSESRNEMWIEAVTTPKSLDYRWRFGFGLRDPGHQEDLDALFETSGGTMIYLGTWHTHPVTKPGPSIVDKKDWRACHRRNKGRSLAFVIVGIEEVRVFVRWRRIFKSLRAIDA